jgi:hypothetical protein
MWPRSWIIDLLGFAIGAALAGRAVALRIAAALPARPALSSLGPRVPSPATPPAACAFREPTRRQPAPRRDFDLLPANGVRRIGVHSYEIRREALDAFMAGETTLHACARIVPEIRNGRPVGFRHFSIRPDSLLAALGIANGDLLLSLNGISLATPDSALDAYTVLRTTSHLRLTMEHAGRLIDIDCVIL